MPKALLAIVVIILTYSMSMSGVLPDPLSSSIVLLGLLTSAVLTMPLQKLRTAWPCSTMESIFSGLLVLSGGLKLSVAVLLFILTLHMLQTQPELLADTPEMLVTVCITGALGILMRSIGNWRLNRLLKNAHP